MRTSWRFDPTPTSSSQHPAPPGGTLPLPSRRIVHPPSRQSLHRRPQQGPKLLVPAESRNRLAASRGVFARYPDPRPAQLATGPVEKDKTRPAVRLLPAVDERQFPVLAPLQCRRLPRRETIRILLSISIKLAVRLASPRVGTRHAERVRYSSANTCVCRRSHSCERCRLRDKRAPQTAHQLN